MADGARSAPARARQPRPPDPIEGRREREKRPRGAPWEETLDANFKCRRPARAAALKSGAGRGRDVTSHPPPRAWEGGRHPEGLWRGPGCPPVSSLVGRASWARRAPDPSLPGRAAAERFWREGRGRGKTNGSPEDLDGGDLFAEWATSPSGAPCRRCCQACRDRPPYSSPVCLYHSFIFSPYNNPVVGLREGLGQSHSGLA